MAGWRRHGARIAETLRPGLNGSEIDAMTADLGFRLPVEARIWWEWHDGTSSTMTTHALGLDYLYLPLENAVGQYRQMREIARATAAGEADLEPEDVWPRSW